MTNGPGKTAVEDATAEDLNVVTFQLGRRPRGNVRIAVRCDFARPVVILNDPCLPDGSPFPTRYWLTCPALDKRISRLEAGGAVQRYSERAEKDGVWARELEEMGGGKSIAGAQEATHVKCLHAHAAYFLATGLGPVGRAVMNEVGFWQCDRDRCVAEAPGAGGNEVS